MKKGMVGSTIVLVVFLLLLTISIKNPFKINGDYGSLWYIIPGMVLLLSFFIWQYSKSNSHYYNSILKGYNGCSGSR